jgi:hypothetical protein
MSHDFLHWINDDVDVMSNDACSYNTNWGIGKDLDLDAMWLISFDSLTVLIVQSTVHELSASASKFRAC